MASITIRNLKDETKKKLRMRAAENGRSLEAEARDILDRSAAAPKPVKPMNGLEIFKPLRDLVEKYGGFELELPPRTPVRDPHLGSRGSLQEEAPPFRMPEKPRRKRK